MDLGTPMDAWYVFLGVSIVSVVILGVVLALPSTPPPEAAEIADAADELAASGYNSSATYDHDATEYFVTCETVALRNSGGETASSFTYASVAPVWPDIDTQPGNESVEPGSSDRELESILLGDPPGNHFRSPREFDEAIRTARERARSSLDDEGTPKWRLADRKVTIRHIEWGNVSVTLVGV